MFTSMREIKFRAWDGKEMLPMHEIGVCPPDDAFGSNLALALNEKGLQYMQYTGLKDKNGKEIYEGDILQRRLSSGAIDCTVEVYFDQKHAGFMVKGNGTKGYNRQLGIILYLYSNTPVFEIIGNIYENPELLKDNHD